MSAQTREAHKPPSEVPIRKDAAASVSAVRVRAARLARTLAPAALGAALVLSPLRYSWVLLALPIGRIYRGFTDLLLHPADVAALLALLLWGMSLALAPRPVQLRPHLLTGALAALTLAGVASAAWSSVAPPLALYHAARLIGLFALYLFVVNEVHDRRTLVWPAGLLVLAQSAVGIAQVLQQRSLGLGALGEVALDPHQYGVSIVRTAAGNWLRAYGLADHPNILGGCLAFALLLLAAGYPRARLERRPLAAALAGLGAAGLLVTFSRSAWLALAAGLALLVVWLARAGRRRDLRALLGLGACALVPVLPFAVATAPLLSARLDLDGSFSRPGPENQSITERLSLSAAALRMLRAHPLAGAGVGLFPVAFQIDEPHYDLDYQPPHLVLLDVAAETGIPGAASYLAVTLAPWALLLRRRRQLRFSWPLAAATALVLAASAISLLDFYPWMLAAGQIWQWSIWGLWGGAYARATEEESRSSSADEHAGRVSLRGPAVL